jgi:glycosyltransferase involved in cell wall biosynthesis
MGSEPPQSDVRINADLTVLICTRNRADSLRTTLELLAANQLEELRLNVIVVGNGCVDHTEAVVEAMRGELDLSYMAEPVPGKHHALNRGLEADRLAPIVAVLDDDMSPPADWCRRVLELCDRWPDAGVFASSSFVIWPDGEDIPGWARRQSVACWAFSVIQYSVERPMRPGEFPSGNHFWFRTSVLGTRRFTGLWATEPHFSLGLIEDGTSGVVGAEPSCGHRIQPDLLRLEILRDRATRMGRNLPRIRLGYPRTVPQAKIAHRHRFFWRLLCLANLARWLVVAASAFLRRPDGRIRTSLSARIGIANNLACLLSRAGKG